MFINFFGRVKDPCGDCINGECTMNCSGTEPAGPSGDKGTLILTREDDGSVTVRARTPDHYDESKVNVPAAIWNEMTSSEAAARDWTDDASHENGNYQNRCIECSNIFIGHKRRVICKMCSNGLRQAASHGSAGGEAVAWRVTAGSNSERHLFENQRDAQLMRDELEENGWLDVLLTPLFATAAQASPDATAAMVRARDLLRRLLKDKKLGVEYAEANQICHEITSALSSAHRGGE